MIIYSPLDFREAARRRVPRFLFDYADRGANDERTLRRNVADLSGISLKQRVLRRPIERIVFDLLPWVTKHRH